MTYKPMTVDENAKRRLRLFIKDVSAQWGPGWPRLGADLQQKLVRAEALAEISRFDGMGTDPVAYRELVERIADAAMQWDPDDVGGVS